jgi:hypothetical protein
MKISKHAEERANERLGLPIKPFEKLANKALSNGIKHSDTVGRLNKYITSLFFYNKSANNTRIYGEFIYLFNNETLITVLNLPNNFKSLANKLRNEQEVKESDTTQAQ